MTVYLVANSTDSELANVNIGGSDIPKPSVRRNVLLTDVELAAVVALAGVAVLRDDASYQQRRDTARTLSYRDVIAL